MGHRSQRQSIPEGSGFIWLGGVGLESLAVLIPNLSAGVPCPPTLARSVRPLGVVAVHSMPNNEIPVSTCLIEPATLLIASEYPLDEVPITPWIVVAHPSTSSLVTARIP